MDAKEALVALNMIEHVGPIRVRQLLDRFGTAEAVLRASWDQLVQVAGIGEETARTISGWEGAVDLSAELKRVKDYGCHVLTPSDEAYPRLLREIYDPPIVLYVRGEILPADRDALAVVGSRQVSHYGQAIARRLSYELSQRGVTIVSGGARGIDTAAHEGALRGQGRTIAVLGNGLDIVFPSENVRLFERISDAGAVITQFPFRRRADRQSFPIRNRIVAGMTIGTLVVEAGLVSGALITANMALDYGRQVFAVPGRIDAPQSRGCHELIKQGAKLCEGVEDVFSEFEYLFPPRAVAQEDQKPDSPGNPKLSRDEQQILELMGHEETSLEALILQSSLPTANVSVALLRLEMKRLVKQLPGKIFVRA